eukprot:m.119704 g.119704  ORF g.119704 m.119704 type:complete len:904 (+) comp16160_c0_seq2:599-3310(+)
MRPWRGEAARPRVAGRLVVCAIVLIVMASSTCCLASSASNKPATQTVSPSKTTTAPTTSSTTANPTTTAKVTATTTTTKATTTTTSATKTKPTTASTSTTKTTTVSATTTKSTTTKATTATTTTTTKATTASTTSTSTTTTPTTTTSTTSSTKSKEDTKPDKDEKKASKKRSKKVKSTTGTETTPKQQPQQPQPQPNNRRNSALMVPSPAQTHLNVSSMRERVESMFDFAYGNYLKHAFPKDELDPIHCRGRGPDKDIGNLNINDVLGNFSLTLIDSLDTLAVMGKRDDFIHAVRLITETVSFDQDSNVQVFEVTIRVLGGLLAGHLIAVDPDFDMRPPGYTDELLQLAHDLGSRLLPAFENTPTGLPYPRVNLRRGVLPGWRNDTCTAGAGTLLLEFGVLSRLVDDPTYELVARRAALALFRHRSPVTGLLGSVIDVQTGAWLDQNSGLGAGSDSFYEYLFKAYILFGRPEYLRLFTKLYNRSVKFSRDANVPVFLNVNMHTGQLTNTWIDSLQAYVPALQVLTGEVQAAIHLHALYAEIWQRYGAMPERFNWHLRETDVALYPLRPELAEATYVLFRATRDPVYLRLGAQMVADLQAHTQVRCGYATLHSVESRTHEDRMESFFLAETLKYLYLLFDDANILHTKARDHIFTTQAHIFRLRPEFHTTSYSELFRESGWADLLEDGDGDGDGGDEDEDAMRRALAASTHTSPAFSITGTTNVPWIAGHLTTTALSAPKKTRKGKVEAAQCPSSSNEATKAAKEKKAEKVKKAEKAKKRSATTTTVSSTASTASTARQPRPTRDLAKRSHSHEQCPHDSSKKKGQKDKKTHKDEASKPATKAVVAKTSKEQCGREQRKGDGPLQKQQEGPAVCEAVPWWKRLFDPLGPVPRYALRELVRRRQP